MDTWYVNTAGGVVGPVDTPYVERELGEGRINAATLVCKVGEQSWRALSAVPELQGAVVSSPAVPPPPPPPQSAPAAKKLTFLQLAQNMPVAARVAIGVIGIVAVIGGIRQMRSGVSEMQGNTASTETRSDSGPTSDVAGKSGLPTCASNGVTQAAKQAIETTMAQKNMPVVATISRASQVRHRPEPEIRVCVAALDTRLGHETLYYSVRWQQQGAQTVPWVEIIGNNDDGR